MNKVKLLIKFVASARRLSDLQRGGVARTCLDPGQHHKPYAEDVDSLEIRYKADCLVFSYSLPSLVRQ